MGTIVEDGGKVGHRCYEKGKWEKQRNFNWGGKMESNRRGGGEEEGRKAKTSR